MRRRVLALGLTGLLVAGLGAWGVAGALRLRQMQQDIQALERDIAALRARSERLAETIDRLRNDPAYLEKLAREQQGFVRPGEQVLKFPPRGR